MTRNVILRQFREVSHSVLLSGRARGLNHVETFMDSTEYFSLLCHVCMCPSQQFSGYMYDLYGWLESHVQASVNSTRRHQ